jgi:hypothetical protein
MPANGSITGVEICDLPSKCRKSSGGEICDPPSRVTRYFDAVAHVWHETTTTVDMTVPSPAAAAPTPPATPAPAQAQTADNCSDPDAMFIPVSCLPKTNVPFEPEARVVVSHKAEFFNALTGLVKGNGYRCDSISAARPFFLSAGYTLSCNDYRYEYEIADKGGRWIVTVK